MQIAKEVICGVLADVERLATEDFRRSGYEPMEFVSITDLGHNGRYRSWLVKAEVLKTNQAKEAS